MTDSLRPMSTGELLDRTFLLYRKNFWLFVGIATVGPAANLVFQLFTVGAAAPRSARATSPAGLVSFSIGILAGLVVMLAGFAISHAATVKAVAAVHLGRATTVIGAYRALRGRVFRVLGVFLLMMLLVGICGGAIVLLSGVIGGLAFSGGASGGRAAMVAGALVAIAAVVIGAVLAVAIWVRYALAIPACVVEDLGPIRSLKRSAQLSKGARGRILSIYLVFGLLSLIVAFALSGAMGAFAQLINNLILKSVLVYSAGFVAGSLTGPLGTIGISLLYYDERVRKEAFDLQFMMTSLDEIAQPLPAAIEA